jgi:hypothetical protein
LRQGPRQGVVLAPENDVTNSEGHPLQYSIDFASLTNTGSSPGVTGSFKPSSPKQQRQTRPQPQPQQQEPPKPSEAPAANSPIARVQAVHKDVKELQAQVNKYSGNSRKDKEYIYLDEMLTRNLLKLDDIDIEGQEDVRQARKDVIRTIQRCISCLEEKAPLPEENREPAAEKPASEENKEPAAKETMDVGTEECQVSGTEGGVTVETAPTEGVMEVSPPENATEGTVAEADKGAGAEAKNAAPAVSEQAKEKVEETGSLGPVVEEQKMEVAQNSDSTEVKTVEEQKMEAAQSSESTEVKTGVTGEVNEQVPMEVDENKQNVEKPQPVSKSVEPKKNRRCGKNIRHVRNDSSPSKKTDLSAGGDSDKVPVREDTDSKVESGEVPLASQPQVE